MTAGLKVLKPDYYDEKPMSYISDLVLTCDEGYEIDDPKLSVIKCNEDGNWNSTFPTCLKS